MGPIFFEDLRHVLSANRAFAWRRMGIEGIFRQTKGRGRELGHSINTPDPGALAAAGLLPLAVPPLRGGQASGGHSQAEPGNEETPQTLVPGGLLSPVAWGRQSL